MFAPVLGELFAARRGGGTTCNGAPVRVSAVAAVSDALVCTGFNPAALRAATASTSRTSPIARRRCGATAARRSISPSSRPGGSTRSGNGISSRGTSRPGALLIDEACGRPARSAAVPLDIANGSILASNGALHAEMERLLGEV